MLCIYGRNKITEYLCARLLCLVLYYHVDLNSKNMKRSESTLKLVAANTKTLPAMYNVNLDEEHNTYIGKSTRRNDNNQVDG